MEKLTRRGRLALEGGKGCSMLRFTDKNLHEVYEITVFEE